jgi:hypothetical protein
VGRLAREGTDRRRRRGAARGSKRRGRRSALGALERHLAADELALRDALDGLDVRVVELDRRELANVDTPRDLEALRLFVR